MLTCSAVSTPHAATEYDRCTASVSRKHQSKRDLLMIYPAYFRIYPGEIESESTARCALHVA
jgi:hypothetical protein